MKPERSNAGKRGKNFRPINFRKPAQSFLIVCEGRKTEPLYFEAFKVPKDVHVKIIGKGYNTVSLVEDAIALRDEAKMRKYEYDQVWCVFDVDNFSKEAVNKAITLARKKDIKVAISNQAFELWYLLHFRYHHTANDRKQYIEMLTIELNQNMRKMFASIPS